MRLNYNYEHVSVFFSAWPATLSFHHIVTWFALLQHHQPESIVFGPMVQNIYNSYQNIIKWLHLKHQTLNIAISIVCTKIIAKDYQLTNSSFYLPVFRNTSIFHAKRAAGTQTHTSSNIRLGSVNNSQAILALFLSPPDNPGIMAPPTTEK